MRELSPTRALDHTHCVRAYCFMRAAGIEALVRLLQDPQSETAHPDMATALWALSANHPHNQAAIADAGGIAPLVAALGRGSMRLQEQSAGTLASLALDNPKNAMSIMGLIVALLGSGDTHACARGARALSHLTRAHPANQASITKAGGVTLLVELLVRHAGPSGKGEAATVHAPGTRAAAGAAKAPDAKPENVLRELAAAIWSISTDNPQNQVT